MRCVRILFFVALLSSTCSAQWRKIDSIPIRDVRESLDMLLDADVSDLNAIQIRDFVDHLEADTRERIEKNVLSTDQQRAVEFLDKVKKGPLLIPLQEFKALNDDAAGELNRYLQVCLAIDTANLSNLQYNDGWIRALVTWELSGDKRISTLLHFFQMDRARLHNYYRYAVQLTPGDRPGIPISRLVESYSLLRDRALDYDKGKYTRTPMESIVKSERYPEQTIAAQQQQQAKLASQKARELEIEKSQEEQKILQEWIDNSRTWVSKNRASSVKAVYSGSENATVNLTKQDGSQIAVPIRSLCADDQAYVREQTGHRLWVSKSGSSIYAKFSSLTVDRITLTRESDGAKIHVTIDQLDDAGRNWIRSRLGR